MDPKIAGGFASLEKAISEVLSDGKLSNVDFHRYSILQKSVIRLRKSV